MTLGIGGAGCKLAALLDDSAVLVNVSETELAKVPGGGRRILASLHAGKGQFRGSRKDRRLGMDAYLSVKRELLGLIKGNMVFSSTGGGTGNGIVSGILADLTEEEKIATEDKTFFAFLLPYAKLESSEFISNTSEFLAGPLAEAIDSGNTGNIVLFSNRLKFEKRLSEQKYNQMLIESLEVFLAIPEKNDQLRLLDGHIDHEDFALFCSKPYFNHFTYFDYNPEVSFEKQLNQNGNQLLLAPEAPIEALFLLEVPEGGDPTVFYSIVEYFTEKKVSPIYSVVENPSLKVPFITVSLLYSRKPAELVNDFNEIAESHAQAKVQKSLDQYVSLARLEVNMANKAREEVKLRGEEDVLAILKRLGKL
ncbi:MAG: hypothetical protein GX902_13240 [Lentisphaerae bacterium]|nr:hypothetical protein [Lentisphaerota bacterium]